MRRAERIEAINRCAKALSTHDWSEIDFILGQFELATRDRWDDPYGPPDGYETPAEEVKFRYVREMLTLHPSTDEGIAELDDYLAGDPAAREPTAAPWTSDDGTFRIFLSHLATQKTYAHQLKQSLAFFGVDSFVAHEDIDPGAEWQRVVLSALHSCHAFVALLHAGFSDSKWCDQETGIALAKGVPTVPVRIDMDPYGFLATYQAVNGRSLTTALAAGEVVTILIRDKRTADAITDAMVERLARAWSFKHANRLSGFLANNPGALTWQHLDRLRQAQKANMELEGAWGVDGNLERMESALPARPKASAHRDDDPF